MNRPYYIAPRPCGDFAVQRVVNGSIKRWALYATREEAQRSLAHLQRTEEGK